MNYTYQHNDIFSVWEIFTLDNKGKLGEEPAATADTEKRAIDIMNFLDGQSASGQT